MMEDLRQACFFCSKPIKGKRTREHIIPNSLLGRLGIKEETLAGQKETQYSRIKVPAHSKCNSEFGSNYENRVIELLDDIDALHEALKSEELSIPMMYMPDESATAIITTWLSKIFYGIFYYDLLTTKNDSWRSICSSVLRGQNFNYVQNSYENGHGFQLPSSLYSFKTINSQTDLVTNVNPSGILFKIDSLTLILCICDGFLTKNYLNETMLAHLRGRVRSEDQRDVNFPSHKLAFAEILALWACIPKTPKFILSGTEIINMSLATTVANPEEYYRIDNDQLQFVRAEILGEFGIKFKPLDH